MPVALAHPAHEDSAQELDQAPRLIKRVEVNFPENMRMAGLEGRVQVEFIITAQGEVSEAHVVASNNPAFEREALDAVMKWRFDPGIKAGRPVKIRAQQQIIFSYDSAGRQPWKIGRGDQSKMPPEAQWDVPPEPFNTAFPVYPFAELLAGRKGQTKLNFVVHPDGRVVEAHLLEATTPEFGRAVLAMIDTWEFKPARKKDGTPTYAIISFAHEFKPNGSGDAPVPRSARAILRKLQRAPQEIATLAALDAAPRPISRRPPVYPLGLRAQGQMGEAEVEFFIDECGDAQLPRVVSASAPEFGGAAVQAVASWRFQPPKIKGRPVTVRVQMPIRFKLEDEGNPDNRAAHRREDQDATK